jgi:uncharacterized protein (TIGR01244 family)
MFANDLEIPMRAFIASLSLALVIAGSAAAGEQADATSDQSPATPGPLLAIPNARVPMDGVLSGGQPSEEQIEAAARTGIRTVINLRTDREPGFEWERDAVERLGMRYVHIPVAGAGGLTRDNVEAVDRALKDARAAGPTLLHCGSGNRVGAMLALRRAWLEDAAPGEALAYGQAGGLTGLEPAVRELLDLAAAPPPAE